MTFNELAKVIEPDFQKIHIHFNDQNFDMLANSVKEFIRSNAKVGTIYVGNDNEMHIVVSGNYF